MLSCRKDQKQDSEVRAQLILEKKTFTLGRLSDIFYFHSKQKPCVFQDLRSNDYYNLMKPIIFSYQHTSRGMPSIHQTRKSSNKILVIILEHHIEKQCITNTFHSIDNDIW